jgi:hypothetical protein
MVIDLWRDGLGRLRPRTTVARGKQHHADQKTPERRS